MNQYLEYHNLNVNQNHAHNFRELMYILFTNKLLWIFIIMLIVIPTFIYVLVKPYTYESNAKILIKLRLESLNVDSEIAGQILGGGRTLDEHMSTEVAILESQNLIGQLVDIIGINAFMDQNYDTIYSQYTPENWKQNIELWKSKYIDNLHFLKYFTNRDSNKSNEVHNKHEAIKMVLKQISITPKSNIIDIGYTSYDPLFSQKVLETYLELYEIQHNLVLRPDIQAEFFMENIEGVESKLMTKENELESFLVKNNIVDLEGQKGSLIRQIGDMNTTITRLRSEQEAINLKINDLQNSINASNELSMDDSMYLSSHTLEFLHQKLTEYELDEAELENKYIDNSRPLTEIRNRISKVNQKINEENERLKKQNILLISNIDDDTPVHPTHILKNEQANFEQIKAQINLLNNERDKYISELNALLNNEKMVKRLNREIVELESSLVRFQDNHRRSLISSALEQKNINNIHVIQPPNLPIEDSATIREKYRIFLIAIFIGLFGGMVIILFKHFLNRSYLTPTQIENELNIPVLCTIQKGEI